MFLVDRANADWEAEPIDKLGWKGVYNARMTFDGVRVPAANKLANIGGNAIADGQGMNQVVPSPESVTDPFARQQPLKATFSFMRPGMAYMAVGIMQAAFDEALAYVDERETFG